MKVTPFILIPTNPMNIKTFLVTGNPYGTDIIITTKNGVQYNLGQQFTTDFASIPSILRGLFDVMGKNAVPALLHDYLCRNKIYPRKVCDKIFYDLLTENGVVWIRRKLMYYAVRVYSCLH